MNKKLLAATIAAVVAAPSVAMANDVTTYGVVHASIDYLTADYSNRWSFLSGGPVGAEDAWDGWDVASRASRIGFKGTEDLSNGLKAIWKMEFQVDIADAGTTGPDLTKTLSDINSAWAIAERVGTPEARLRAETTTVTSLAAARGTALSYLGSPTVAQGKSNGTQASTSDLISARNMYIGLAGGFGTFLVGRHDTPYKMSTGSLDLFADTLADYNSTLLFTDIRTGSAIAYVSPSFGGLTLAGAIVAPHLYSKANSTLGTVDSMDADGLAEAYSLAAMYSANGFFASAAFEEISGNWYSAYYNIGDAGLDDDQKWRVGLGFTGGGFTVGAVYENQKNVLGLADTDKDAWQVQAGYTFGNNMVKAMYGQTTLDWANGAIEEDWSSWAVGLDHNFSKRTKAYVLYTDVSQDIGTSIGGLGDSSVGGWSVGMVHSF